MDATTMAVDLAKDIFEVAVANRAGRIVERKRLTRRQFERMIDTLPAGTDVVMEACGHGEARIGSVDQQLARIAREHPIARRLQQVPGVGVLTSTALVGTVSHIHAFRRGRYFAGWLGLTPRESSTGHRRRLGGISKRGDVYVRCLLTHGARAVLLTAQRTNRSAPHRMTRLQQWAVNVAARRGHNTAAIAVPNKLARTIWAVWHREVDFRPAACETDAV